MRAIEQGVLAPSVTLVPAMSVPVSPFPAARISIRLAAVSAIAVLVANCASQPQASRTQNSREVGAFSHPKYGKASPRVVGLDESAPKGGGRYQVGKPYVVAGKRYVPREKPDGYTITGNASWYGIAFHGRKTANGEIYDRQMVSAAHPTMPLPSYARVTNTRNNHSIVVRVNDRGPYHGGRILDVSERTANLLGFKHLGTARVKVDYLGPASLGGSDDQRLVASLRTDGPASAPAIPRGPVMVATTEPVATALPQRPRETQALGFAATAPASVAPFAPAVSAPPQPAVVTATRFAPAPGLPVPPARPFDLETIGGASAPLAPQAAPGLSSLPKAQPIELALGETAGLLTRFGASGTGEQHWLKSSLHRIPAGQ